MEFVFFPSLCSLSQNQSENWKGKRSFHLSESTEFSDNGMVAQAEKSSHIKVESMIFLYCMFNLNESETLKAEIESNRIE